MDGTELVVKYLIACTRITVPRAAPDNPYTLHNVRFQFEVPADHEWPIRLDELWLFARFYNGRGTRSLGLSVVWLDALSGVEQEFAYFELPVVFPEGQPVFNRGWNVSVIRYPGPGRYAFRMCDEGADILADDVISIRRGP